MLQFRAPSNPSQQRNDELRSGRGAHYKRCGSIDKPLAEKVSQSSLAAAIAASRKHNVSVF